MKGYIGVTSREWFLYLSKKETLNEVNFWRKNTDNFRVLKKGEPFFFIVKNQKEIKGERAVLGKAIFERFEVITPQKAWERYGDGNGDENRESFLNRMNSMFETDRQNGEIGCIILSDFQPFSNPVHLSEIGIEFKNSVVSGKGINETELNTILEYGFANVANILQKIKEVESIGFTEEDEGFPEGKQLLKLHLIRERNSEVIKLAKKRFFERYGKLFCQVCKFDFNEHYGDIGEGYIEGHHTKPISEMDEKEDTKVEDIALVCANCHRMLHRRRPWLLMENLKELINK